MMQQQMHMVGIWLDSSRLERLPETLFGALQLWCDFVGNLHSRGAYEGSDESSQVGFLLGD